MKPIEINEDSLIYKLACLGGYKSWCMSSSCEFVGAILKVTLVPVFAVFAVLIAGPGTFLAAAKFFGYSIPDVLFLNIMVGFGLIPFLMIIGVVATVLFFLVGILFFGMYRLLDRIHVPSTIFFTVSSFFKGVCVPIKIVPKNCCKGE